MITYTGSLFVYWFLECTALLTCLICGWGITKSKDKPQEFWKWGTAVIAVFTFVKGFRYGRGVDYIGYANEIIGESGDSYELEPVFRFIETVFRTLHIDPAFFFASLSFLLIYSYIRLIKQVPGIAVWALPMFYIIFGQQSETMVRQDCAISFLLLAYSFFLEKKNSKMLIFVALAFFTHFSAILAIIPFLLLAIVGAKSKRKQSIIRTVNQRNELTPYILTISYLLLEFLWQSSTLNVVADWLSTFDFAILGGKQNYLENADVFLGERESEYTYSLLYTTTHILARSLIIFFGYQFMRSNKKMSIAYYYTIIAIIFNLIGGHIMTWNRVMNWFIYLTPVVIGGIMCEIKFKSVYVKYGLFAAFFMCYYFYFIKGIGTIPPLGYAFIWDI